MTLQSHERDEFRGLLELLLEEELDDDGQRRLADLLADSEEAQWLYIRELNLHAGLAWDAGAPRENDECGTMNDELETGATDHVRSVHPSSFVVFPSGSHPVFFPSFAGVVLSYVFAALFLGVGVLAARLWSSTESPRQFGRQALLPAAPTIAGSARMIIGRITAMSNCRSIDPRTPIRVGDAVPGGRYFVVGSGLLEIAYTSGPTVILQGPASYVAANLNGGVLIQGKLTVRTGKLDRAAREVETRAKNLPAPSPDAAAFCLRTQTAVVYDSGKCDTRFGVEVDETRATYAHVFQGLITLESSGIGLRSIRTGESVWTGSGPRHSGLFVFKPDPRLSIFVLEMPPPVRVVKRGIRETGGSPQGGG